MRLHHVEYGTEHQGVPIVFLGSIASTTAMWVPQLDALSQHRHVIALDHRGHGGSPVADVAPGEARIADLAADVLETLDALGVGEFAVVGLSLGGAVTQYLAANSPRVVQAAFLATATNFGTPDKWQQRAAAIRAEGMTAMLDTIVSFWFTPEFATTHPATVGMYRDLIAAMDPEGYAGCADALAYWDFEGELPKITVDTLVLAARDDQSTGPAELKKIANGISGQAQYVEVSPGAHVPTIEVPSQVNQALLEFFVR